MEENCLRIVSYNVRKARGLDQRRDPDRILQVINQIDADIVVLQEADRRLGPRRAALPRALIAERTDYRVAPVARNGVSLGWHGNAVLHRPGIAVRRVLHIALPGLEPRGAVALEMEVQPGAPLALVATHLGLRRRDRLRQQARILAHLPKGMPAVVAGDFNEWSPRLGLEPFDHALKVHAPGHSYHARRPLAALDRFALSPGIALRAAGVAAGGQAARASDHLPIWAELSLPPWAAERGTARGALSHQAAVTALDGDHR